jgi:Na+/melibiose symporter-like transporter
VLTCALIGGPESGWLSLSTLSRAIGGVAFFGVFILVERRRLHPMLDLALFRSIPFIGAVTAMFAYAASAQVMASLLPLYLQNARGHATLAAGIAMLPFALAMLILPQAGRRLARYLDACRILTLGLLLVAAGNLLMAWAADGGSDLAVACAMALLGSGGGLLNGETQKAIMGTVPPQRAGLASGISTTARFTGILLGFSSLSAVLAGAMRHVLPQQACSIRELPCPLPPQLAADLAAGDIERALARYPQWATPLHQLVRHAYAAGFPVVFVSAALLASVAALIVFRCMRKAV